MGCDTISGITHKTPFTINSLPELADRITNNAESTALYQEVAAFYKKASVGTTLHIITFPNTRKLSEETNINAADSAMTKLMEYTKGSIRQLGVNIQHATGYTYTNTEKSLDADVLVAIGKLQEACDRMRADFAPFVSLLGGIGFGGDVAKLPDLSERSDNTVAVLLSAQAADKRPSVGLALGTLCALDVSENIGKVKLGAVAEEGYMTDGKNTNLYRTKWQTIHNKGYIFFRSFVGKQGVFFNYDATATGTTDDYAQLSRCRTIFKAIRISYTTYINELLSNTSLDSDGRLPAVQTAYFEGLINNAIANNMSSEISAFKAAIDPAQNLLQTGKMQVSLQIVPLGQLKTIEVLLGFSNKINS